jgi:hypothetical protein
VPQHNPYDSNVQCATPEPGPLPENITWGQSSIVVEGGYLCGVPVAILLEQIPNQLVLRDTINLPGAPRHGHTFPFGGSGHTPRDLSKICGPPCHHSFLLVEPRFCVPSQGASADRHIVAMGEGMQDLSGSGPNGGTMRLAAKTPQSLRYVFSDVWNGLPSTAGLPVELWPYVSAHRVFATAPPSAGIWKTGQIVWQEVHRPSRYNNGSIRVATYPEYEPFQEWEEQAPGAPLGWVCAKGGEPGRWVNVSSIGEHAAAAAAGGGGGEEESAALREEVTELRRVVEALVGRVAALEAKPSP